MIHSIARLDDPRVAAYARVGDPAYLRASGLFVAEGRLVVRRLLEADRYAIESVLVTPAALTALADVLSVDRSVYVAEPTLLTAITGFNFHRGCLAIARRPAPLAGTDVATPFVNDSAARLVALEGIGNPDNVGGIFRVAAAFGVAGVLLDPASGDPLYRKAIRTSMGAVLQVPFARCARWPDALSDFQRSGFRVLALTPRADASPMDILHPGNDERWIVVAGAEGAGLSDAALATADVAVRIPMAPGVDSLNVTVAVGIVLARLFC